MEWILTTLFVLVAAPFAFDIGRLIARYAVTRGWWFVLMVGLCATPVAGGGEVEEAQRIADRWEAQTEVRQWDGTRVDILTETHAYEVDWPIKWAEGVGQSLYYGELTGKRPGLVLLVTDIEKERRYVYRAQTLCVKYGIKLHVERIAR